MRVLHVVNYGWPWVDGYTVRSRSLVSAQRAELGIDAQVVVSPWPAFARARDPELVVDGWGPDQHRAVAHGRWAPGGEDPQGRWTARLAGLQRPHLGLAPGAEAAVRRGFGAVIDEVAPDVVHAHHPAFVGRPAVDAARERGVPVVYELRCFNGDYDLDGRNPYLHARGHRQNRLELALCRRADHVVTIADGLRRRIVAAVPPERVSVVRNAVDATRFAPADRGDHDPSVLRVGYATTFEAIEGLDTLVEAAALARGRLGDRRLQVEVAGAGRDHERIAALVEQRGLGDVVTLPGFVPAGSMPAWYAALDLFVVPRRAAAVAADTTPLKPLEALATGLPMLVSDLPAMRELLDGREGVRFAAAEPEPLAAAIAAFASAPWTPATAPDLGDRAWSAEVHRYPAVYEAATARAADRAARGRRPARAARPGDTHPGDARPAGGPGAVDPGAADRGGQR